jgi:cohesin loading factor subunit SCC2
VGRAADRKLTLQNDENLPEEEEEGETVFLPGEFSCSRCVLLAHPLGEKFLSLLGTVMAGLKEKSSKMRGKAMRCLTAAVSAFPQLLDRPDVATVVESRFFDQSILVREAAVDLAGQTAPLRDGSGCVFGASQLGTCSYHKQIADRINDTGVSVRKKAVKMLGRLLQAEQEGEARRHVLAALAGRLRDEEKGVRVAVREVLERVWFTDGSVTQQRAQELRDAVSAVPGGWLVELLRKLQKKATPRRQDALLQLCHRFDVFHFLFFSAFASATVTRCWRTGLRFLQFGGWQK